MNAPSLHERFTWTLARLNAWRKGSNLYAYYKAAKERDHWSPDALAEFGNRRLRDTVSYAYDAIPYYRRTLDERGLHPDDIQTIEDLPKLPILERNDVREHYPDLQPTPLPPRVVAGTSSGSTAEPVKFLSTTDAHAWHSAARLRAWEWAGYRLGHPTATLWASRWEIERLQSFQGRLRTFFNREMTLEACNLSDAVFAQHVERLRRYRPRVLYGVANAMHLLTQYCLDNGIDDLRFDSVGNVAETLLGHQRTMVEELFRCKVYDRYSTREIGIVGDQCQETTGFHIAIDNCAMEIVNNDGVPVGPGEMGSVVVTDYCNKAMPFIRYRVGDMAEATADPCPCGLPFPLFRRLLGREKGFVKLRDTRWLSSITLTRMVRQGPDQDQVDEDGAVTNIRQFQVIQESFDDFTVKLALRKPADAKDYRYIVDNFREMVTPDARVTLEFVERIPLLPSGKCPPVISRLDDR
ncbi:MAG: phenylacetate--CoA ligase family protein [bacterium]|nr:phenylacetate--CoA ligase family protein [bacterium]